MTDWTLAGTLAQPMVPTQPAEPLLDWQPTLFILEFRNGPFSVWGCASHHPILAPSPATPWQAFASGPRGAMFKDWAVSAQDAMVAVEDHISNQIDNHLREVAEGLTGAAHDDE